MAKIVVLAAVGMGLGTSAGHAVPVLVGTHKVEFSIGGEFYESLDRNCPPCTYSHYFLRNTHQVRLVISDFEVSDYDPTTQTKMSETISNSKRVDVERTSISCEWSFESDSHSCEDPETETIVLRVDVFEERNWIEDIAVVPVPLPVVMLLSGLAGLLIVPRRRVSSSATP